MRDLVDFTLRSVLDDLDQLSIGVVEGQSSVLFEVNVSDADRERLLADDRALLSSVQAVVSASSGKLRAVVDLVEPNASGGSGDSADQGEE